jgi:hypothetical protein
MMERRRTHVIAILLMHHEEYTDAAATQDADATC